MSKVSLTQGCSAKRSCQDKALTGESLASPASHYTPKVVSLAMLEPVLAAFGCMEGSSMERWVQELGVMRAEQPVSTTYLSFQSNDLTVIHWIAKQAGWHVMLTDGASREVKAKKTGGSAAFDMNDPESPWLLKTVGRVMSNTRAEYEAGILAWLMLDLNTDAITFTDSEDFMKLAGKDTRVFAARAAVAKVEKNAQPAAIVKFIQFIATGHREVLSVRAHCGCQIQDKVDEYAKDACEVSGDTTALKKMSLSQLVKVLQTWGSPPADTEAELKTANMAKLVSGSELRLNMEVFRRPGKAMALKSGMISTTDEALKGLLYVQDKHAANARSAGQFTANKATADKAALIEDRWRHQLITQTLKLSGVKKVGMPNVGKPKHTQSYSSAQSEVARMKDTVCTVRECLEARKPSSARHWAAIKCDMLSLLHADGRGEFNLDPGKSAADMLTDIAYYVQYEDISASQRSYGAIIKLLDKAEKTVLEDEQDLEANADEDFDQMKYNRVYAVWAAQGQCKQLGRAVQSATAKNEFKFGIPAIDFVNAVAGK